MWPAIIGAVGSLVGGMIASEGADERNDAQAQSAWQTNQFNAGQAELARTFSAEQASRQMEFQREMSGSSYQRAVGDLKAAGLNPMLAYSQGGASTPGGAMGQSPSASGVMPHMENVYAPGVSTASEIAKTVSDLMSAEQQRKIKGPLENVAKEASAVIDALKAEVAPLGRVVSEAVLKIEDTLKGASVTSAPAVKAVVRAIDVIGQTVEDVKEVVRNPGRVVQSVTGSAASAGAAVVDVIKERLRATESAVSKIVHGERGVSPPPSRGKVPLEAQRRRGDTSGFYKWEVR